MRLRIAQQKVGTMLPYYIYDLGDVEGCEEKKPYQLEITTRAQGEEVKRLVIENWPVGPVGWRWGGEKGEGIYLIRMDEDEATIYHFGILEVVSVVGRIDNDGAVLVTLKFWSPSVLNGFSEEDKNWVFI